MNKNKIMLLMMIFIGWLAIVIQANAALSIIPEKKCLGTTPFANCIIQMTAGSSTQTSVMH